MKIFIALTLLVFTVLPSRAERIAASEAVKMFAASQVDETGSLCMNPEFYPKLDEWTKGRALEALDELTNSVGGAKLVHRFIHFSAERTTDAEFLDICLEVLRLYTLDKADRNALDAALVPPSEKLGLLDVSFRDPRVFELLPKVAKKLPPKDVLRPYIEDTLSGQGAKNVLENHMEYPRRYRTLAATALNGHGSASGVRHAHDIAESRSNQSRLGDSSFPASDQGRLWLWLMVPVTLVPLTWLLFRLKRRA